MWIKNENIYLINVLYILGGSIKQFNIGHEECDHVNYDIFGRIVNSFNNSETQIRSLCNLKMPLRRIIKTNDNIFKVTELDFMFKVNNGSYEQLV